MNKRRQFESPNSASWRSRSRRSRWRHKSRISRKISPRRALVIWRPKSRALLGVEQSTTLAKSLQEKEVALQRAEQKVATVEAKFDEYKKATLGDRALFEEKIAKLTEQLDAESAARLFAEGALRSARQERSARRQEGHDVAAESPSAETESADSKVTWLRR